jgi:hypothetical protein
MIRPPRRTVTRFFIPLIDVLILLFGIFILMPFVNTYQAVEPVESVRPADATGAQAGDPAETARQLQTVRQEAERLRRRLDEQLQKLVVRTLEINGQTGKLYALDPDRRELGSQAEAQAYIARQRERAGERPVYFLFLLPRELSAYPTRQQVARYRRWFQEANVPFGFDDPGDPLQ